MTAAGRNAPLATPSNCAVDESSAPPTIEMRSTSFDARSRLVAIAIAVLALVALTGVAIGPGSGNVADNTSNAKATTAVAGETTNVSAEAGEPEEAEVDSN